jgi:hypothetical protein
LALYAVDHDALRHRLHELALSVWPDSLAVTMTLGLLLLAWLAIGVPTWSCTLQGPGLAARQEESGPPAAEGAGARVRSAITQSTRRRRCILLRRALPPPRTAAFPRTRRR